MIRSIKHTHRGGVLEMDVGIWLQSMAETPPLTVRSLFGFSRYYERSLRKYEAASHVI